MTESFSVEDEVKFPRELVGRPTSEVLMYLAGVFGRYAEDTEVLEEQSEGLCTGYLYAQAWLLTWASEVGKVEAERCAECMDCLVHNNLYLLQFEPVETDPWYCARCSHTVRQH